MAGDYSERVCELEGCDVVFRPRQGHQKFCCVLHRKQFWKGQTCGARIRMALSDCCEACGYFPRHRSELEVDHIVERVNGGTDDLSNLRTLCANCHKLRHYAPDVFISVVLELAA